MVENDEKNRVNPVFIRDAIPTDLSTIIKILRNTVQTPYGSGNVDEAEVQMEIGRIKKAFGSSEEGKLLLVEDGNNQSLGFAFIGKPDPILLNFTHSDPETTLELRLLYMDPSQRLQGVGSQLIEEVEEQAKEMGMNRIELTSGPRYISIGTGTFYKKKGYTLVGILSNYFERIYPARVFQKDLR